MHPRPTAMRASTGPEGFRTAWPAYLQEHAHTLPLVLASVSFVPALAAVAFGLRYVADSLGWWAFVSTPATSVLVLCCCLVWARSPDPRLDRPIFAAMRLWFVMTLMLRCVALFTSLQPVADLARTLAVALQVTALYLAWHGAPVVPRCQEGRMHKDATKRMAGDAV